MRNLTFKSSKHIPIILFVEHTLPRSNAELEKSLAFTAKYFVGTRIFFVGACPMFPVFPSLIKCFKLFFCFSHCYICNCLMELLTTNIFPVFISELASAEFLELVMQIFASRKFTSIFCYVGLISSN